MPERILAGRYELRSEPVGQGGMAVVYEAWDIRRKRRVAVKILRDGLTPKKESIEQFENEAHSMLKMQHANIVKIYGLGYDDDMHYMVMEYVDGETLKDKIDREGCLGIAEASDIIIKVLAAVHHAHRKKVVHRDIKPQNILIDKKGNVKVIDFGIAKALERDELFDVVPNEEDTGSALGSIHYFSPEQAQGRQATEKSDLYSVGVVLYEMLTGKVPFTGRDADTIARRHIAEKPVPPADIVPGIPESMSAAVMKALEKRPEDRFHNAAEMAGAIRRAAIEEMRRAQAEGDNGSFRVLRRFFIAGAVTVGILIAVLLAGVLVRSMLLSMPKGAEIPDVTGRDIEDGIGVLSGADIPYTIEIVDDEDSEAGTIIAQDPSPGMRLSGDEAVVLSVSLGASTVFVPDITGMTVTQAMVRLDNAEMELGEIAETVSDEEAGIILAQVPEAGTYAEKGSLVSVTVSAETCILNDMTGMPVDQALELLNQLGLSVGSITYEYSDLDPDIVLSQSVPSGTRVMLGESVDLVISELDMEKAYKCVLKLDLGDVPGDTIVTVTLAGEQERVLYEETAGIAGSEQEAVLYSADGGDKLIRIYINDVPVAEKQVSFR